MRHVFYIEMAIGSGSLILRGEWRSFFPHKDVNGEKISPGGYTWTGTWKHFPFPFPAMTR